jgi:dihydrodipicolinate synthase/N-acetylneuraminate lyase
LTNPIEGFAILNGWDSLTFYALSQGAQAAAWGVASGLPKECVELWDAFQEKDI